VKQNSQTRSVKHNIFTPAAESRFAVVKCEPIAQCWHLANIQGDHFSGKPGNVREFDSCQGNVREFAKCQGKILLGKSCLKLFLVSCIFASILDFAEFVHFVLVLDDITAAFLPHH